MALHYKYQILLSDIKKRDFDNEVKRSEWIWSGGECYTYLLMPQNYNVDQFYDKFQIVFEKYYEPFGKVIPGKATATPLLQPLTDVHLKATMEGDEPQGNINYVYTSAIVGFFIILLACINYMNLTTARSVIRTKEMGIRKVLGYTKFKLFVSVLLEALILSTLAMFVAVLLSYATFEFSAFNSWMDKDLHLDLGGNPILLLSIIIITIFVGLVSGIYPAWYIPTIPVISALKGSSNHHSSGVFLRKALIVFQFTISIGVVIVTLLMGLQIRYLTEIDLGFDKENILIVRARDVNVVKKADVIISELKNNPSIISSTISNGGPSQNIYGMVFKIEQEGEMVALPMSNVQVGENYLHTMGLKLTEGRDFIAGSQADFKKAIIINQAAARELGWEEDPLNKRVTGFHGDGETKVVGVVKDFNFLSLHNKVDPLFIFRSEIGSRGDFYIRIKGGQLSENIAHIEGVFNKFDPSHPFEFKFMDEEFDRQYKAEQTQQQMISILSYICICISILGLIGLSAFTAGQKAKEISIRKTLGASVNSILFLFSKGYVKLIVIAACIAIPLADYFVVEWLSGFAYQMTIEWYFYAVPGVMILFLGLLTVVAQSLKSAQANPVDGLRSE